MVTDPSQSDPPATRRSGQARTPAAPPIREDAFQKAVIAYARLLGWRVAHFRPAKTERGWRTPVQADGAGFPDLVMLRHARMVVAELKSEWGGIRPEQREWLDAFGDLSAAIDQPSALPGPTPHIEVHVWRPSDWPFIEKALR